MAVFYGFSTPPMQYETARMAPDRYILRLNPTTRVPSLIAEMGLHLRIEYTYAGEMVSAVCETNKVPSGQSDLATPLLR